MKDADPENGRMHHRWYATSELRPGMVLARPLLAHRGGQAVLRIASGARLTTDSIGQLILHGVECAAIQEALPDPDSLSAARARHQSRLAEIFGPDPAASCRELFDTRCKLGPCTC